MVGLYRLIPLHSEGNDYCHLSNIARMLLSGSDVYRWTGPIRDYISSGDFLVPCHEDGDCDHIIDITSDEVAHLEQMTAPKGALLWDQSFMWGMVAYDVMRELGFDIHLINRADIEAGRLWAFDCLFVPGGWASQKSLGLGEKAKSAIREFVACGGTYLGFCGGAGFSLDVPEGLGLLPVTRLTTKRRIPNFSGTIQACLKNTSPYLLGLGLPETPYFNVWWPSQFEIKDYTKIRVLATYGKPGNDFFVSDLNANDVEYSGIPWEVWEACYGMNLCPDRLIGEPAMIHGKFGKGDVLASYFHLETPGDYSGNLALFNLWHGLPIIRRSSNLEKNIGVQNHVDPPLMAFVLKRVQAWVNEIVRLIDVGERHLYLAWRNPWLLRWKRGGRGFEINTIFVLLKSLEKNIASCATDGCDQSSNTRCPGCKAIAETIFEISALLQKFMQLFHDLIMRECLKKGHQRKKRDKIEVYENLTSLEKVLFNGSRPAAGLYLDVANKLSDVLYCILRTVHKETGNSDQTFFNCH